MNTETRAETSAMVAETDDREDGDSDVEMGDQGTMGDDASQEDGSEPELLSEPGEGGVKVQIVQDEALVDEIEVFSSDDDTDMAGLEGPGDSRLPEAVVDQVSSASEHDSDCEPLQRRSRRIQSILQSPPGQQPRQLFRCEACSREYASEHLLHQHRLQFHTIPCPDCDKTFSTDRGLKAHRTRTHGAGSVSPSSDAAPAPRAPVLAVLCGGRDPKEDSKAAEEGEAGPSIDIPKFQCPLCTITRARYRDLAVHYREAHPSAEPLPEMDITCPKCEHRYKDGLSLKKHFTSVHQ
uniref:C2H2-type domain-containing protein n=2 Tax=Eutreptiella gymnastica TaxID=73025 RepID=A0A7S1ID01_9EUGL|mmetsp:Transcript_148315/g.259228  ORF Transcript_148315/g.259228 Transcript_148315/m.259228 type:complete len:294 (+) Transcript_148315:686-1567(+)